MWMLALSDYMKYGRRNAFLAFQISLLMIVLIVMTATVHEELRMVTPVADMRGYEGMVYRNPGYYADTPKTLIDGTDGVEKVFTYGSAGFFSKDQKQYFTAAVYTDEAVRSFKPELAQGQWLDDEGKAEVVVSQNENGWRAGDEITLWFMDPGVNKKSITVHVCGVLKEGATILGREFGQGEDFHHDYRDLYSTYRYQQEREPLFMFHEKTLENYGVPVNYANTYLLAYGRGQSGQSMRKMESGILRNGEEHSVAEGSTSTESLSDFTEASRKELFRTLIMYLPLLICILLVTLISIINVCTLNTRESYRQNAVFFLLGLHWKRCRDFTLYQNVCTIVVAGLLTAVYIGVIRLMGWQEYFYISWNVLTTASILAAVVVLFVVSAFIPGHMMKQKQPVEILREERI